MARATKKKKELTIEEKLAEVLVPVEEQPHPINNNWKWLRLNVLCNDIIVPQRDKPKSFGGNIPWCRIEDIEGKYLNGTLSGQYVTEETIKKMNLRVCPSGTVICSCSASLGRQAILTTACCTNQTFIGLVCHSLLYNEYLYYYLMSLEDYWHLIGTGTTIKYISRKKFELLPIPLPPLPEQQRIVDRIESLFAKLDEAKEKAQAVVDGFEDRKAAILHKAFTGELTAEWRKKKGILSSSWKQLTVKDACRDVKVGIVIKPSQYYTDENNGTAAFRSANVREFHIDDFDWVYLNDVGMSTNQRSVVHTGDVLVVRSGNPGTACVVEEKFDGYNAIDILIAVPNKDVVTPDYLCAFTNSPMGRKLVAENKRGMALAHFNVSGYSKLQLPLPSVEEQEVIVSSLFALLEKEQQAKEVAEQVISQIDTMKKSILARAFRGELGTNDPTDESAVELLKRVL